VDSALFENTHTQSFGYANEWTLDKNTIIKNLNSKTYTINPDNTVSVGLSLYYVPQKKYYTGLLISVGTILCSGLYLIVKRRLYSQDSA
jgi:hypothetical protein